MKRKLRQFISVFMAAVILLTGTGFAGAADAEAADNSGIMFCTNAINGLLNGVFAVVGALFPKDFDTVDSELCTLMP